MRHRARNLGPTLVLHGPLCTGQARAPRSCRGWPLRKHHSMATKARPSSGLAAGVSPQLARNAGLWNLDRWRPPPSHSTVTMVCPGPSARAALTAPTQFMAALLPTNRPSDLPVRVRRALVRVAE